MNTPASLPLFQSRVVPVVVVSDAAQAVPMAEALLAGGVDVMEITLRSAAALAAIEAVARAVPAMQVGAGTVTRASEVAQVQAAGARFGLSPGSTPKLPHETLSQREYQVFEAIAAGRSVGQIALELGVSSNTVSTYRARIMEKTGTSNDVGIALYAVQHKLIQL